MRRAWARLEERLDEIDGKPVLIAVTLFIAAFLAALIWGGDQVLDVVLAVAFVGLALYCGLVRARSDQALDETDKNTGRINAVENHLSGLDAAGSGKHQATTGRRP